MTKVLAILVVVAMGGLFIVGLFKRVRRKVGPSKPVPEPRSPSFGRMPQPEEQFFLKILAGILFFALLALWNFTGRGDRRRKSRGRAGARRSRGTTRRGQAEALVVRP